MDLAVSKALDIYDAEIASRKANSYFLSLPLGAPDFMQAYDRCKRLEAYLLNLKNN